MGRKTQPARGEEQDNPSPGVIGGAALVGACAGALISGPLVAIGLGAGAAALTLRRDQVSDKFRLTRLEGFNIQTFVENAVQLHLIPTLIVVYWRGAEASAP